MIGGLPMIAEIVRSTANVANGAKTRWSNFFHGLFILIFVAFGAAFIDQIPQAALAALLIVTGYRLASPKSFQDTFNIGKEQLALFVITIIGVLATDLLVGVGIGIAAKFILHLVNGAPLGPNLLMAKTAVTDTPEASLVNIEGAAIFSNYFSIKRTLDKLPAGKAITIDLSKVLLIDHSVMEHFHQFERERTKAGTPVHIVGLELHKPMSTHPLSARKLTLKAR
jgi:MFS superfamily sulfate permease-like transporter